MGRPPTNTVAALDGVAHGLDVAQPRVVRRQRSERGRRGSPLGSCGREDLAASERLDPRPHLSEAPISPADVAIDRPCRQPREARPAVPGQGPVLEAEPERWQVLVDPGDRRQPLEPSPRS